jgi:excinuclease ABC subunit B
VGINLLREGLDLPEVSLVVVLDADKEGFLRSEPTLIQICGRAARNVDGRVLFYADNMTGSMQRALKEMSRRRNKQIEYNEKNKITPKSIVKAVHDLDEFQNLYRAEGVASVVAETQKEYITAANIDGVITDIEERMKEAADNLDFETAALLRDKMLELKAMRSGKPAKKIPKKK